MGSGELLDQAAEGLWERLRLMILALHRLDGLESADDFQGWLEGLPADRPQMEEIARELTLRALRTAADPVNHRLLGRLADEGALPVTELMREAGLSRLPLQERVNEMIQVGLVGKDAERGTVVATALGQALAELSRALAGLLLERMEERLPSLDRQRTVG